MHDPRPVARWLPVLCAGVLLAACALLGSARMRSSPPEPASSPASAASAAVTTAPSTTQPAVATSQPDRGGYQRGRYNRVYREAKMYTAEANAFLTHALDVIAGKWPEPKKEEEHATARRALDIASGEGRNSILLTQHGYQVTAFDISDVGVQKTIERAAAAQQEAVAHGETWGSVEAIVADVRDFDYGEARWDVVAVMYFSPSDDLMDRVKRSVKGGGWIVMEHFSNEYRGHIDATYEPMRNQLLKQLLDWDVYIYEHTTDRPDWHWGSPERRGQLLRILARKPQ